MEMYMYFLIIVLQHTGFQFIQNVLPILSLLKYCNESTVTLAKIFIRYKYNKFLIQ